MKSSHVTTETIKILLHLQSLTYFSFILLLLFGLCLFGLGISRIIDYEEGVSLICASIITTVVIGIFIFNSLVPINVTKTTHVQKEKPQIIQVDGKLLSSDGLTLFLKDSHGNYSKKKISVDGDVKIREEGNSYAYTQIKTKVTYDPKDKVRAIFSEIPDDTYNTKTTLIVPKGTLTQNK